MIPIETTSQILSELNLHEDDCQMVTCVVCDTYCNARKVSINVSASATCQTLLGRVANRLGYKLGTFLLYHQEPDGTENTEEGVCLNEFPDKVLQSIVGNSMRQNFYVTMKDGEDVQKEELVNTEADDVNRNPKSDSKPSGLASIINDCSTSNLSYSKDNKVNYGSYNLSYGLMKSDTGYVGLVNQAMTCYLNSLLQTLYMTPEFRNAVYRWEYEGTDEEAVKSIPYQLQKLFLLLQTIDKRSVGTTDITKSFGWDSSDAWHQHDIQELCRVMFDALEKTWKNTEQADLINQLYQGRMKDCVQCLQCGWESARIVAYQDIPLAVKPFGEGKAYGSVEESLQAFCAHELLDGNNQWFCEKCGTKVNAHKSLKFITFPYLLTMHLMRFDFDYNTLRRIKLNHRISFPEVLDLNEYVINTESLSHLNSAESKVEQSLDADATNGVSIPAASSDVADSSNDDCSAMDSCESDSSTSNHSVHPKGPYEYELFSIMVHSGNASGGHYYAYIKSFETSQWFSFNDQNVSAITYDDIKKTYGGSSSVHGHYSSSFASSTNAYMLMYRRIDKERNAKFMQADQFPAHLQRELKKMQDKEDSERRQQEMERNTCKIKLFIFHPTEQKFLETTLAIHMNKTLAEATEVAWKLFELEGVVPLDCVRLVKYDGPHDYIDRSFDGEEDMPMHRILGGVKFLYGFDLLLEVKQPGQSFTTYKSGSISVKVFLVDLTSETISFPVTVRATLSQTVGELKDLIAEELGVSKDCLRCVLETHSELKPLLESERLLKAEGFTKSNKIFVETSATEDEAKIEFRNSRLFEILDRFENTIRIHVQLPLSSNDVDASLDSVEMPDKISATASSETVPLVNNSSDFWNSCSTGNGATGKDKDNHLPADASICVKPAVNCNSSATAKTSDAITENSVVDSEPQMVPLGSRIMQESCSGDTDISNSASLPTEKASNETAASSQNGADSWDLDRGDWCNGMNLKENTYRNYFRATLQVNAETKERSLCVALDKRITLESLKICLEPYVGTTSNNFEVYRVTSSGEEIEMKRLSESLSMYDDDCQFKVKIGRPLQKGEHRVKIHQLIINDPEPIKFLTEVVISKGMTILQAKVAILKELKLKQIMDTPSPDRCRLRRKCWKNPGTIYNDIQAFTEQDVGLVPNMDLLLEVLDAPDQLRIKNEDQMSIYVRQWSPSKYELGSIAEIIIDEDTPSDLMKKISAISEIKEENVQFFKISGVTFPYDMSVFEIHTGLSWIPRDNGQCTQKNLAVFSDGAIFFYKDKTETLKILSNEEKKEIQQRENSRSHLSSSSITSSWRKERALKIYLDETPKTSSSSS